MAILFGLIFPWLKSEGPRYWFIFCGGSLCALGSVFRQCLGPVYRIWMKIGHVLGLVNTFILLHLVFYCIFMPMAILLRLVGWKSPVRERPEAGAITYRAAS